MPSAYSTARSAAVLRWLLGVGVAAIALLVPARAAFTVANLHCSVLLSPATAVQLGLRNGPDAGSIYGEKFDHLARLIASADADFVALEAVAAKREVEDLAVRLSGLSGATWKGIFIPGASKYAARNLAVVYRPRRGLEITGAGRIQDLTDVPTHLVFTLAVDGTACSICVVDLADPEGVNPATYAVQLKALQAWAARQSGTAIIMGAFNDEHRKLPPLFSINERLGWPATELGNRGRDYIFSSRALPLGEILPPPFGQDPGEVVRARWTDHFLVKALVP